MMFPDLQLLWQRADQVAADPTRLAADIGCLRLHEIPIIGLIYRCLKFGPRTVEIAQFATETANLYAHCLSKPDMLPAHCSRDLARLIVDVCRVIATVSLDGQAPLVLRALQSIHAIGGADYLAWVRQEVSL